jgi:tRNA1(Val) A37 N6-methylase TrmN6
MTTPDNPHAAPRDIAIPAAAADITEDTFLGNRLSLLQPARGYRAGIDAVLLAATAADFPSKPMAVLDCGAGVGTVGLCVAARCPQARVTLVEREPALVALARRNIARNGFSDIVALIKGDVAAPASHQDAPRVAPESFDLVLANPPYHDAAGGTRAGNALKQVSHAMEAGELDAWVRFAARTCRPGGRVTLIHKADALAALLETLQDRFGNLTITPIHPYAAKPAIRILVSGIKGSRAPLSIAPPLVLHDADGAFTPYVGRILRQGAPLDIPPAIATGNADQLKD